MIVLSLFLTIFVYLAFPVVYRLNTDGTTPQKAKKYALINVICGYVFFNIIYLAAGANAAAAIPPAVLYYYISKKILTKSDEKKGATTELKVETSTEQGVDVKNGEAEGQVDGEKIEENVKMD